MKHPLNKYFRADINNLLEISQEKLDNLGYKQRVFKGKLQYKQEPYCEPGDLLCATNTDKMLWIVLDERSAKSIDPGKFLVYFV